MPTFPFISYYLIKSLQTGRQFVRLLPPEGGAKDFYIIVGHFTITKFYKLP